MLPTIWLCGVGAMMLYGIVSYLLLKRRLQEAVKEDGCLVTDRVKGAFVMGCLRPRIYLPAYTDAQNRPYIVAHERAHIARGDHWWKLLGYITLAVHWFNPVVWLGYVLYCWDTELACDEAVVASMDLAQRKVYSAALVACSSKRSYLTMTPVPFGDKPVRKRIRAVLNYREPGRIAGMVALVVTVILAVCFLTDPVMRK